MNHVRLSLAGALLFLAAASLPALADPQSDACAFARILTKDGSGPAITFLEGLADQWSADQRSKLAVVVGSELAKFQYQSALVYQVANIPGSIEEYLAVMNLRGTGSVYVRLLFEGNGSNPKFINVDFRASYYDILQPPFFQQPTPVTCG